MASTPSRSELASGLPYYVWEVPDKKVSIHLHYNVIDRMSPDILRGLGALKRRGAEVGGILLGRSEDGPVRTVIVEDFEPIPSEYLTGPSYNPSPNDLQSFEAAIARHSGAAAAKSVVGFYRSHTRDELYLDNTDLDLAHRYFSGPENIFLVIKPFTTRPSVAGFFFWEDGKISRDSSYLLFPFQRRELGGGETQPAPAPRRPEPESRSRPPARAPESEPAAAVENYRPAAGLPAFSILKTAEPPARPSLLSRLRPLVLPALMLAVCAGSFFAYSTLKRPEAALEAPLPLKLAVADDNGQLDVTWNRNSAPIATAQRGVLSIADGSIKRNLELTGAQLRDGRVLYSRLSGDVSLRLEVFPEGQPSVVESIRILSGEAPPPQVRPTPPPPEPVMGTRADGAKAESPAPPKKKKPATRPVAQVTKPAPKAAAPPAPPAVPTEAPPEVELQRPARR